MDKEQCEDDPNDSDIIGVIKIKDGLFICDELGAQVSGKQSIENTYKRVKTFKCECLRSKIQTRRNAITDCLLTMYCVGLRIRCCQ